MPQLSFDPSKDIPDSALAGKVVLVTGGTAGLGYETVVSLAAHHAHRIFFTGRNQAAADALIKAVRIKFPDAPVAFLACDLASFESVRAAAKRILTETDRLDIVFCNAGIMAVPPGQSKEGYEIQFGTNHMGHSLLIRLLMPLLEKIAGTTHDVRIIWNTSEGYFLHPKGGIVFDKVRTSQEHIAPIMAAWTRYGQSKLANLLYARALAKHYPSVTSVAVHPGVSATGLVTTLGFFDRMLVYSTNVGKMLTPEQCAYNQQWAATASAANVRNGGYYVPVGVEGTLRGEADNDDLAEKLWNWTQQEIDEYLAEV